MICEDDDDFLYDQYDIDLDALLDDPMLMLCDYPYEEVMLPEFEMAEYRRLCGPAVEIQAPSAMAMND